MVLVASSNKPFEYTSKNTPRRLAIIANYDKEIDAAYKAAEETAQGDTDVTCPPDWSFASALPYVRGVVQTVMQQESISDDADIFQLGCDSLQAVWIRNTIARATRDSNRGQQNVPVFPPDVIFENPSVSSIARFVADAVSCSLEPQDSSKSLGDKVREMQEAVKRHTRGFSADRQLPTPTVQRPAKDTVLVTGTTGSLGSQILATLVESDRVGRIYAMNRRHRAGTVTTAEGRQREMFKKQGLSLSNLESSKIVFVEAGLDEEQLGLDSKILDEIRTSVTHIIHNAWRVDFNLTLRSFEMNIRSVRHLIDLALSSPLAAAPAFLFINSVGVVAGADRGLVVSEEFVAPEVAGVGSGYGQSKWVAEALLQTAAEATALRPVIIRAGQICGNTRVRYWNSMDWFPAMVKSSIALKCFPSDAASVSWIPIDTAAQFVVGARNALHPVLHLVHPRPSPWTVVTNVMSSVYKLTLVSYSEWLAKLEEAADTTDEQASTLPALKILPFFRGAGWFESSPAGMAHLDTSYAQASSVVLGETRLAELSASDVEAWIAGWKDEGFFG